MSEPTLSSEAKSGQVDPVEAANQNNNAISKENIHMQWLNRKR